MHNVIWRPVLMYGCETAKHQY